MSSSWGCPNEVDGVCQKVRGALCDPGMMGCVIQGLVERIGEPKGPRRPVKAPAPAENGAPASAPGTCRDTPGAPGFSRR